jgi:hypothetical protein
MCDMEGLVVGHRDPKHLPHLSFFGVLMKSTLHDIKMYAETHITHCHERTRRTLRLI